MSQWSPYQDNGGSAVAIAGPDYATIVADTRCTRGYSILSRNKTKVVKLTDEVCLVSCGMRADIDALQKKMQIEVEQFKFKHREAPSIEALSQRLSVELYSRRFFPYYALNILAGVSRLHGGKGAIYSYDAVGNTEEKIYGAVGAASAMMLSVLDLGLGKGRRVEVHPGKPKDDGMGEQEDNVQFLPAQEAVKLGVDALTAGAERNIETGDSAEAWLIDGAHKKVECQVYSLRKD